MNLSVNLTNWFLDPVFRLLILIVGDSFCYLYRDWDMERQNNQCYLRAGLSLGEGDVVAAVLSLGIFDDFPH